MRKVGSAKRKPEEGRGMSRKKGLKSKDYGQTEEVSGRGWGENKI